MNPWNLLTQKFNTTTSTGDFDSADNIHIAWPVFIETLEQHFAGNKQKTILDYGCGAGAFCQKLSSRGYQVTGIDSSEEMIQKAKAVAPSIPFLKGDAATLRTQEQTFDAITSLMVFQFVEDIEETFENLTQVLHPNGIFLFAVFNPAYVTRLLQAGMFFKNFDSVEKPTQGISLFDNSIEIPTFIRTAEEYEILAQKNNLQKIFEGYPPFTKEFITQFPSDEPTDVPEYLILGFKK